MAHHNKAFTSIDLIVGVVMLAAVVGWVANIIQIIPLLTEPIGGLLIFKCVGVIIAPLGVILGFVGFF